MFGVPNIWHLAHLRELMRMLKVHLDSSREKYLMILLYVAFKMFFSCWL